MKAPIQPAGPVYVPDPAPVPNKVCCSFFLFLKDILLDQELLVYSKASISVFPGPKSTSSDEVCLLTDDVSLVMCSGTCIILRLQLQGLLLELPAGSGIRASAGGGFPSSLQPSSQY